MPPENYQGNPKPFPTLAAMWVILNAAISEWKEEQ